MFNQETFITYVKQRLATQLTMPITEWTNEQIFELGKGIAEQYKGLIDSHGEDLQEAFELKEIFHFTFTPAQQQHLITGLIDYLKQKGYINLKHYARIDATAFDRIESDRVFRISVRFAENVVFIAGYTVTRGVYDVIIVDFKDYLLTWKTTEET